MMNLPAHPLESSRIVPSRHIKHSSGSHAVVKIPVAITSSSFTVNIQDGAGHGGGGKPIHISSDVWLGGAGGDGVPRRLGGAGGDGVP